MTGAEYPKPFSPPVPSTGDILGTVMLYQAGAKVLASVGFANEGGHLPRVMADPISQRDLCLVSRKWQVATFAALSVLLVLNLIVAVGNWQLYSRVKKLETILGLQAKPQSPQKSSSEQLPQTQASMSSVALLVSQPLLVLVESRHEVCPALRASPGVSQNFLTRPVRLESPLLQKQLAHCQGGWLEKVRKCQASKGVLPCSFPVTFRRGQL
jgi:hypothetical protein